MAIELHINGYFDMSIYNLNGTEVEKDIEIGILDNLQQAEYVISMNDTTIVDINALNVPLYKFNLIATNALSYDFEPLQS